MTGRRILYVTPGGPGPYQPARLRRVRGWTIVDTRTGRIAWTEPHPLTGRARPAIVPTFAAALQIAEDLARQPEHDDIRQIAARARGARDDN